MSAQPIRVPAVFIPGSGDHVVQSDAVKDIALDKLQSEINSTVSLQEPRIQALEQQIQQISVSGGASTASEVSLESVSGLVATNVQTAVAELSSKKADALGSVHATPPGESLPLPRLTEADSSLTAIADAEGHNLAKLYKQVQDLRQDIEEQFDPQFVLQRMEEVEAKVNNIPVPSDEHYKGKITLSDLLLINPATADQQSLYQVFAEGDDDEGWSTDNFAYNGHSYPAGSFMYILNGAWEVHDVDPQLAKPLVLSPTPESFFTIYSVNAWYPDMTSGGRPGIRMFEYYTYNKQDDIFNQATYGDAPRNTTKCVAYIPVETNSQGYATKIGNYYLATGSGTTYQPGHNITITNNVISALDSSYLVHYAIDDTARNILGSDWRMPTYLEFQELLDNTTAVWLSAYGYNQVPGVLLTSIHNSNSIFLPAGGRIFGDQKTTKGQYCYYWTSTVGSTDSYAKCFQYLANQTSTPWIGEQQRYDGITIRPVSPTQGVDLELPSGLKWASANLASGGFAASNDTSGDVYGDYFAWGEFSSKSAYRSSNYKFYDYSTASFTKYNSDDEKYELDLTSNVIDEELTYAAIANKHFVIDTIYSITGTVDQKVGSLSDLTTTVKSNIVSAVNEVKGLIPSFIQHNVSGSSGVYAFVLSEGNNDLIVGSFLTSSTSNPNIVVKGVESKLVSSVTYSVYIIPGQIKLWNIGGTNGSTRSSYTFPDDSDNDLYRWNAVKQVSSQGQSTLKFDNAPQLVTQNYLTYY